MQPNQMDRTTLLIKLEKVTLATSAEMVKIIHYLVLYAVTIMT